MTANESITPTEPTGHELDLAGIRARAEAATPGPWEATKHGRIDGAGYAEVIMPGPVQCMAYCYGGSSTIEGDNLPADAEHIAGMDPVTTLALVDEVERLRAVVEQAPHAMHCRQHTWATMPRPTAPLPAPLCNCWKAAS